jgi:CRP-like cAMP-binding protein
MFDQHSFQATAQTAGATAENKCAGNAAATPKKNLLLAALPPAEYERLLPDLEHVSLPKGWTVHGADQREKHLYFPTDGIVSRMYAMENGTSAEIAVIGNEGVIGVASFLGGESTPSQATVLCDGNAYRLRTTLLKNTFAHDDALLHLLLRYTLVMIAQAGQTAVCNRYHSVQQQLCLWLLSCLDRSPSNDLALTQEQTANMLGVRREGISQATGKLHKAGLVDSYRGHVVVLDRAGLELRACECYSVVKREFDRLRPRANTGNSEDDSRHLQ